MAPWISLTLMVLAGLGLVLRHDLLPVIGFDLGIASVLTAIAGLLVFSGRPEYGSDEHGHTETSYRHPMIIATLALVLFTGYTFSGPLVDVITGANGNPPPGQTRTTAKPILAKPSTGRAALRLRRQANGLFSAPARVNGSAMELIVDTGATTIVLSAEDARRAGINVTSLRFTVPLDTAHGAIYAAQIQLKRVFVGPLGAADVAALVVRPGQLEFSVLGMSFLKRLRSYAFEGNHLTLEG